MHVWVYTTICLQRVVILYKADIPDYPLCDLLTVPAFPAALTHCISQQLQAQTYSKTHVLYYFVSNNDHGNGTKEIWGRSSMFLCLPGQQSLIVAVYEHLK